MGEKSPPLKDPPIGSSQVKTTQAEADMAGDEPRSEPPRPSVWMGSDDTTVVAEGTATLPVDNARMDVDVPYGSEARIASDSQQLPAWESASWFDNSQASVGDIGHPAPTGGDPLGDGPPRGKVMKVKYFMWLCCYCDSSWSSETTLACLDCFHKFTKQCCSYYIPTEI